LPLFLITDEDEILTVDETCVTANAGAKLFVTYLFTNLTTHKLLSPTFLSAAHIFTLHSLYFWKMSNISVQIIVVLFSCTNLPVNKIEHFVKIICLCHLNMLDSFDFFHRKVLHLPEIKLVLK